MDNGRHLLLLGCSSTKLPDSGLLPAIHRYNGGAYLAIKKRLRESAWPDSLSVGVLSAKYGLIGGLTPIEDYDERMDLRKAECLRSNSTATLTQWCESHNTLSVIMGKEYRAALDLDSICRTGLQVKVDTDSIGLKNRHVGEVFDSLTSSPRPKRPIACDRPLYFLPDWDDLLDVEFDFAQDEFSAPRRSERSDRHCIHVMKPTRMCDGVLVSLAQHMGSKGALKRFGATDSSSLAPRRMRSNFGLEADQWLFGDCGAFTYANEESPAISTELALSLYELNGFDFGTSVDHIPLPFIMTSNGKRELSQQEREDRVKTTKSNAEAFVTLHRRRKCGFTPVGVIQAITAKDYGAQLHQYVEMGYGHIALGGLVPKSDTEIVEIVEEVHRAKQQIKRQVWIHLFGVFRPNIQDKLRANSVNSFDSATYFRKAWLRSDQNYLSTDGSWYAAVRVPVTKDARTLAKLAESGLSLDKLRKLERNALAALHQFDGGRLGIDATLDAVAEYDITLNRSSEHWAGLLNAYRRTLEDMPWKKCLCPICSGIGIDVLIFRGCNRNKRRGAHNTAMLYRTVSHVPTLAS